ncbi:MAG: hypothetical protein K2P12_03510, partial [Clostridia bacterium]|nr:hypothetical protein [Clostridia bacterium]
MLLSFLYNKPIIENQTAKNLGGIAKLHINGNKIDYFMSANETKVAVNRISFIKDVIMFDNDGRNYPDFKFYPINGQLVTDEKGKIYGKLIDLQINKEYEIRKLITDNKNLSNVNIISVSDSGLVFKRKPKSANTKGQTTNTIISNDPINIVTTISNYTFLIGRVIQKNIMSNDTIIIPAGKIIDKKDIDKALKYGKIIDITL